MDDEYSYLDSDEGVSRKSRKKQVQDEDFSPNPTVTTDFSPDPILPKVILYFATTSYFLIVYQQPEQQIHLLPINEDSIFISQQFFKMLLSLNDLEDPEINQYLNENNYQFVNSQMRMVSL